MSVSFNKIYQHKNEAVRLKPAILGATTINMFTNNKISLFVKEIVVLTNTVDQQFVCQFKFAERIKIHIVSIALTIYTLCTDMVVCG
jgi:hypothetical protein